MHTNNRIRAACAGTLISNAVLSFVNFFYKASKFYFLYFLEWLLTN